MPKYLIPVVFQMGGVMEIVAPTLEKAEEIALTSAPWPDDMYYIDDSTELDKGHMNYGEAVTAITKQQLLNFISIRNQSDLQTNLQFAIDAEISGIDLTELGVPQPLDGGYVWETPYGQLIEHYGRLELKEVDGEC